MNKTEWFKDWFDTEYYHLLYANRNDEEAEVFISNLCDHLKIKSGSDVLDLACGKGRHSRTLNKLGFKVTGADLSGNSIKEAILEGPSEIHYVVHDMREVIPQATFDVIFNLFTSFGYFDGLSDNARVIQSISTMLEKDGLLVIDFMNARKVIDHLVKEEVKNAGHIDFNISRRYDGKHIFKDIKFNDDDCEYHYTERVQALFKNDFEQLLDAEGLTIIHTFGNFDLEPFNEENSDRLIIIAKK
ncbi:MAG: class I SAM-dependent methyltransferase [Bacteroidetes bacterium]|nr:MAG: class I SAM-dependent methyltransferase [Bacteroidota bacterium]